MLRKCFAVLFVVAVFSVSALSDEYKGKIKSVNADQGTLTVTVNDKDQDFKVPVTAKITAGKKDIADGLKAKQFKRAVGAEVTIVTEKKDGVETVTEVRITGKKKNK